MARFIHVNHRYAPFVGGSERYVQEVAEMVANRGHHSEVVTTNAFDLEYFWDSSLRAVDAPGREEINGVGVRRVPINHIPANSFIFRGSHRLLGEASRVFSWSTPFDVVSRKLPRLPGLEQAILDGGSFDVLHATNIGLEGLAATAFRVADKISAARVLTPFIHLGTGDQSVSRRYVSMPHQGQLMRSADLVFAMTTIEADFLASLGVRPDRISVSGVGISVDDLSGGDGNEFKDRHNLRGYVVGALGALARDKGTVDTVLAIAKLRKQGHDVSAVLAGPAIGSFRRWFENLSPEIREGIILAGVIDASDKRNFLNAIDVLVVPSKTESFGIVYLEAWANGKPVIGADAGAVTEVIQNGETGLLVPFGNPTRLAAAIRCLMKEPSAARQLGERGRQLTLRKHTWDQVLQRIQGSYMSVLGIQI